MEVRTDCERRRHVAVHLGSRAQNESHVRVHAVHQKRLLGVRTAFLTACKSMRESKSAKVQSILRSDTAIPTVSQDIDGVSRILTSVGRTMCNVLATPVKARPPLTVPAPVVALTACRPQADCAAARRSSTPTCSCCHRLGGVPTSPRSQRRMTQASAALAHAGVEYLGHLSEADRVPRASSAPP